MGTRSILLVSLALIAVTATSVRDAHACGVVPGSPTPCADALLLGGGQVPANVGGIHWSPTYTIAEIPHVANATLVRNDGATTENVPFTVSSAPSGVWIVPSAPLVAGAQYTFTRSVRCNGGVVNTATTSFQGAATTVGKSFGGPPVVSAVEDTTAMHGSGSCPSPSNVREVKARKVTLSPAADAPIRAALAYTPVYYVRIDGNTKRSFGTRSGDGVTITAYCDDVAESPIAPGVHTAQLFAAYPGSNEVVESDPVQVDLSCGGASAAEAPSSDAGGCHASSRVRTGGVGMSALGVVAAIAFGIRRRRR